MDSHSRIELAAEWLALAGSWFPGCWRIKGGMHYSQRVRELSEQLAAHAETSGMDSTPLLLFAGCVKTADVATWNAAHALVRRLDIIGTLGIDEKNASTEAAKVAVVPLTDMQQTVFDYIRTHGPKSGKEIVRDLALSSESVLTSHIIPALKPLGVKNKGGAGYYVESDR